MEMPLAAALATAYRFDETPRCERVVRIANDVARVLVSGRAYWLKLSNKTVRPLDELEAEAEIVAGLAARGLGVAAPVRRADGCYAGTLELPEGPCPAVLFDEAPGVEVAAATAAQAEALGRSIARLHLAHDVPGAARRDRIDGDALATGPLGWVQPWLRQARGAGAPVALEALAAEMSARAWPPGATAPLPDGLCHGDLQLDNVRFDGDAPTLFDFEACGVGPCAYDLACYWRKHIALTPAGEAPPRAEWDALLRGYASVRPLAPAELRAVPALATLRAIWVMALPASPRARWGRDWLIDPEYFAAHLAMLAHLADAARDGAVP